MIHQDIRHRGRLSIHDAGAEDLLAGMGVSSATSKDNHQEKKLMKWFTKVANVSAQNPLIGRFRFCGMPLPISLLVKLFAV